MAYVPSKSMEPTLKVGDLVVIKGVEPRYISNGSIIVFYVSNHYGEDAYRIVHRVITIFEVNGQYYFETKGDNNPVSDFYRWQYIPESHVIGVVIYRLPYLGYLPLLIRQPIGIAFILLIAAALILLEVTDTNRTKKEKESLKQINLVKKEMNK